ncbi:MAG: cysteine desulfurase family protein [Acidobacteriota bacterium]
MNAAADAIYLDHNATTPVADQVIEAMRQALQNLWANPSSSHAAGRDVRRAIGKAREDVANLLGCLPSEIIFTSGGTESDNLALLGVARARRRVGRRVVISAVEHPAVEAACAVLAAEGFQITRVAVATDGRVSAEAFAEALTPETAVASLMHANNETGTLQPVREVSQAARARSIPLHSDAAQSVGKIPVDIGDLGVDLLTVAGHKLYGPKGVGALYVRSGVPIAPVLVGAPQENGLRPGTENTPGIVGLAAACRLAAREGEERVRHERSLAAHLLEKLVQAFPGLEINGPVDPGLRLPNTLNVSLPGVRADRLLAALEGLALSSGAACHAGNPAPSGVLMAMGLEKERALGALRLSVGRGNTHPEMDQAAARIGHAARIALNS